jgi:hypothetical protein
MFAALYGHAATTAELVLLGADIDGKNSVRNGVFPSYCKLRMLASASGLIVWALCNRTA